MADAPDNLLGAWFFSALFIITVTFFGVLGMYPGIIISSIDPAYSVTVFNGASSQLTLKIMLGVTLCCIPVVIAYQAWLAGLAVLCLRFELADL